LGTAHGAALIKARRNQQGKTCLFQLFEFSVFHQLVLGMMLRCAADVIGIPITSYIELIGDHIVSDGQVDAADGVAHLCAVHVVYSHKKYVIKRGEDKENGMKPLRHGVVVIVRAVPGA
jgi:hypothetical protein